MGRRGQETLASTTSRTTEAVIAAAYAGLVMMVLSASHQTLGIRRVPLHPNLRKYMGSGALRGQSKGELWRLISRKLDKRADSRPPFGELAEAMRVQGAKMPTSSSRPTRKWVAKMTQFISDHKAPPVPDCADDSEVWTLTHKFVPLLVTLVKKLKSDVAAGPDGITADQIKAAPGEFLLALAFFTAWAAEACVFPPGFKLMMAKFVPKEGGKVRGIRLESLLAKLVEQLVVDPIFPAVGPNSPLIASEHIANKRHLSAEMASAILAMMIETSAGDPLYAIVADVLGAYDNIWREATWAKLLDAHKVVIEVKRVAVLYEKFLSIIREADFETEVIAAFLGIPQGGPRSGDIFCFSTSDLPDELRAEGLGTSLFGVFICMTIFLDDHLIPLRHPSQVLRALAILHDYGRRWSVEWSLPKFKVLCVNVRSPPAHWKFGDGVVSTVPSIKYLAVIFDAKKSWVLHFSAKLTSAKARAGELRAAGLIGGSNIPTNSLMVVRAVLWASLDYGRGAACSSGPGHLEIAKRLVQFQMTTLREVLGLSDSAPRLGVLGETGDIPDAWREVKRQVLLAYQMLRAPADSLPGRVARAAMRAKQGMFARANEMLTQIRGSPTSLSDFRTRSSLAEVIMNAARAEWMRAVAVSERLRLTYPPSTSLRTRGYLNFDFRGRQVLLRLRVDDLRLGAGGYKAKDSTQPRCPLCNGEPETRLHFMLICTSLEAIRQVHCETMQLTRLLSKQDAYSTLILARPEGATENIDRAIAVGALLHDLWQMRCMILGIRTTL